MWEPFTCPMGVIFVAAVVAAAAAAVAAALFGCKRETDEKVV